MPLNKDHLWTEGRETVVVAGSFAPAGTGAVTDQRGVGFSVAYTSTGLFTITLEGKYNQLNCAMATIQMASATDLVPQFGAYTAPTATAAGTITLRTNAAATPTDIAANAANRVNFMLVFRKMDVD